MQQLDARQLLSDAKFYEGYSRYNDDLKRYETWEESVERVMGMHKDVYSEKMTPELEEAIADATEAYKTKLVLGAQRALQFGGDQLLRNPMRMYNCTSSYCDRAEFFGEAFHILLCGAGAGFSVQKHHIAKLPSIANRTKMAKIHRAEDSIEGWAQCLDVLLSSYFVTGGKHPEFRGHRVYFDLSEIRPRGAFISGGFKAPGPEPLRLALDRIEHLLQGIVLKDKNAEHSLRPIDAYDILMHASDAVLAGGVRRSATICLFSKDDEEMLNAKTGNWLKVNPQRARSNNSAVIVRNEIKKAEFMAIMEKIKQFGEPGFVFVESTEHCFNPCVEIGMYPQIDGKSGWQGCNLTEINGGACYDEETFYRACRAGSILGTLQAGYTNFKFIDDVSKRIFEREALIGVSITGWMANPDILFDEKVLRKGAKIVKEINKKIASIIGINPAARTTCVKPSGNASVLLKCPSGITPEHAPCYLRNVQLNKDTEVAQLLMQSNPYMIEESSWSASRSDYVASFPVVANKGALFKDEVKGVKHLEYVKKAQQNWVEYGTDEELCVDKTVRHNVSNTITVDDWDAVAEYVFANRKYFAGVAFMSELGDRAYHQAPNTKIVSAKQIVKEYGTGAVFASGLIVDGLKVFDNLWVACSSVHEPEPTHEDADGTMKRDWVRRFRKFADNYFHGNLVGAELCLKDVHLLHQWEKIQQNLEPVDWVSQLTEKRFTDIDTMGAAACVGTKENGESSCLL